MLITPREWLKKPDENHEGFLEAEMTTEIGDLPIPIETHNVALEDVTINEKQEFSIILESYSEIKVYKDKEDFDNDKRDKFASESYVPSGLFPADNNPNYIKSPRVIISGTVIETIDDSVKFGFEEDDILFTMTCLGNEYDVVIHGSIEGIKKVELNNIVSGIFWVQGWPIGK